MPRQVTTFECLIASPSDVGAERGELVDLINHWNAHIGRGLNVRVEAVAWEIHSTPEMGDRPQELLNRQIVDECDLGIGVFHAKLGTPTGEAESGTVEEIQQLIDSGRPVMAYFSTKPIPQDMLNDDQYNRLQALKKDLQDKGLLGEFDTVADLREQVTLHLTSTIVRMMSQDNISPEGQHTPEPVTAPLPDVRVKVRAMKTFPKMARGQDDVILVEVENHSPIDVHYQQVFIENEDGSGIIIPFNFLSGQRQSPGTLRPGDSLEFPINPLKLGTADISKIKCAALQDRIGRIFRSEPEESKREIQEAIDSASESES
jgi:hypothetical protein